MADGFKAGTVYIAVEPETRGFYAKVKAMLERLDDQTIHLDTDVNTMDARRQIEQLQRSGGTIDFDVRVNTRAFDRVHRELAEMTSMAQIDVKADTTRFDKGLADSFDKMRQNHANALKAMDTDAVCEQRKQVAKLRELNAARDAVWFDKWNHMASYKDSLTAVRGEISRNIEAHKQLGNALDAAKLRRDSFKRNSDEYRAASAEVKRLRSEYTQLGNEIRRQEREAAKLAREHSKFMAKNAHELDKVNGKISEQRKLVKSTTKSVLAEAAAEDKLNNVFRTKDMLIDRNGLSYQRLERDLKRNADVFRKASEQVAGHVDRQRELSKSLLKTEGNVDGLRRSLSKLQFVDTKGHVKDLDAMTRRVDELQKALLKVRDNPSATIKFKAELDKGALQAELARLQRDVEVEVRVNAQQAALERLERELFELEHKRVNIPVDLKVDYENAIAERKRLIEQIRRNPDMDWEVKSNVDIDEANARRKLRDLQNDYDKLDMDVDLETALARAHLAYFTRPRTVDIFAKFHGTDLGKILSGMTAGATGIKGVQNQFQNLVNLFDRLDKVVPRVALVGTVLSDVAAGAINLAGTVGGLGKSIVSMSKAAYAAPAALTGMGLAYASLRMIIGDKGKAWSENINLAGTALEGLGEKLQDTFYGKAAPAFKEFANQVGDVVGPQMRQLAALEADVFTGMLDMVNASRKVGQLGRVFTHVNDSLRLLTPGVESVVDAFPNLSDAGGTYLAQFSNWISRNMEWFATWSRAVQADSATIDAAMSQVKTQAGYLADSFFALKDIAKGVFGSLGQNQNGLERFAVNLQKAARAVNSISFQDTMNAWVTGAQNAQHGMRDAFSQVGQAANIMRQDVASVMSNLGELTGNVFGDVTRLAGRVSPSLSKFSDGVKQGISSISDALADVSPMFGELIEMAGKLSRTFGGTLAATLKAAAPSIEAIAKATGTVADAFNRLPDSIKGALGLWVTFGKAGSTALTALKTGMLDNIQRTLSYRKTLADLGLSAGDAGISFGRLVQAQVKMRSGNIAGVLSDSAKGMSGLSSAAKDAAPGILAVGTNMAKSTGKLSGVANGLKTAGSALLGAVGGLPGIAVSAGLTAAVTAFSSYSQHVSKAREVQDSFNEAARATPGTLAATASSLGDLAARYDNFTTTAVNNLDSKKFDFWDKIGGQVGSWKDAASAMSSLGVSTSGAGKAAAGSDAEYQKLLNSLKAQKDAALKNMEATSKMAAGNNYSAETAKEAHQQYEKVRGSVDASTKALEEQRGAVLKELYAKADAVGVTHEYVDALLAQNQNAQSVSEGLLSEAEKTERLTSVKSKLTSIMNDQKSAMLQNIAAGNSYYKMWDEQLPAALGNVKSLLSDGQKSWDAQSKSFILTSEAGRAASDALTALASNSNAYIESMIANGATTDEVSVKYNELSKNFGEAARQAGVADGDVQGLTQTLLGTPEEVKIKVEAQTLQAKTDLIGVIDAMQFLFPDGSREETRNMLVKMVMSGDLDPGELQRVLTELSDENHTIHVTADGKNVYTTLDGVESYLKHISGERWDAYVQAKIEGKSDVDALAAALDGVPNAKETLLKAKEEGKSLLQAFVELLAQLPESKDVKVGAETGEAHEKVSAFINDPSDVKTIPADLSLDEAESKVNAFAAVAVKKPVQTEVEQPSIVSTIASIGSIIGSLFIPPAKVRVEGDDTDARTKIGAMQAFGGQTLASMLALILGDDTQARNAIGGVSAFNGLTIANPWARVLGENVLASLAINAIAAFGGRTISRPWTRVQGENTMARMAIMLIQAFNGRTIARPWARVDGDASGANAVISAIASTNGSVIATRYVDIVTRGSGEVHAATGGRIHGPGTGTSDSIPAMLSNNEHVIRAASVAKLDREVGPNFLNVLNRTGDISKALANANNRYLASAVDLARGAYATGGRVQKALSQDSMTVVIDGGKTVNQTFNVSTKIVRSDQDLHAAAQIDRAALMRTARREARL